ncbi:MAG: DUF6152 family protein [Gammaproteobacteria bacterium]|jgi:hypothetical protein
MQQFRSAIATGLVAIVLTGLMARPSSAHHSFAMYDRSIVYVLTGVVANLNPDPSHLQIVFVPLNDARDALVRDGDGERVVWAVDMEGAAAAARNGISASNFSRGTVFSVSVNPLRNGEPGGTRLGALFRCPQGMPPAPGEHCDSVPGAVRHGEGELEAPTARWSPEAQ